VQRLVVRWPDGAVSSIDTVMAGTQVTVERYE